MGNGKNSISGNITIENSDLNDVNDINLRNNDNYNINNKNYNNNNYNKNHNKKNEKIHQ